MSPRVPGSHNDYKSPEKARVDRVRGTKSVFESAIWIAINNEQQRVGRGREPTATLLHVETRSLMRGGGTQRVGRYRGCLNVWHTGNISLGFMNELLMATAAAFLLHPESFLWTSPFTQMAPTPPGQSFILAWLITNFRECLEFLLCSRADIREPDCSFWDQARWFILLIMDERVSI